MFTCHFVGCVEERKERVIGSLSNDDGEGNENGKKPIGLISKQKDNFARASRFFVHFHAVVARLRREIV